MLPLNYHVLKPMISVRSRMFALKSGAEYGNLDVNEEHLVDRLDKMIGHLSNERTEQVFQSLFTRPYPNFDDNIVDNGTTNSDIMMRETARQHMAIEERLRKNRSTIPNIRKLNDPATRFHIAGSRGIERELVNLFNNLDGEMYNRRNLKLLI